MARHKKKVSMQNGKGSKSNNEDSNKVKESKNASIEMSDAVNKLPCETTNSESLDPINSTVDELLPKKLSKKRKRSNKQTSDNTEPVLKNKKLKKNIEKPLITNEKGEMKSSAGKLDAHVDRNTSPATNTDDLKDSESSDDEIGNNEEPTPKDSKRKKKTVKSKVIVDDDHTIFIKNIGLKVNKKKLTRHFGKYGKVQSVRFRCVPRADIRTPKKVAMIKKEFHPDIHTMVAYVRFTTKEEAQSSLVENGTLFEGTHIAVTMSNEKVKGDQRNSIFIGNLDFGAEEEDLWKLFESVGRIESVRIIREPVTNASKGIGFVNFESSDSPELVIQLGELKLNNKILRIKRWEANKTKKPKNRSFNPNFKKSQSTEKKDGKPSWRPDNVTKNKFSHKNNYKKQRRPPGKNIDRKKQVY